ncbi:hypothetical protein [Streptomyces blattellae]|uniref:hypothetical protein n=1 Tax=Streptomyces blattellae TaxID=2569855 RepID=UPI002E1C6F23
MAIQRPDPDPGLPGDGLQRDRALGCREGGLRGGEELLAVATRITAARPAGGIRRVGRCAGR